QAIELEPKYGQAYVERGEVKKARSDYPGAMADYMKALELDPNNAEAGDRIQELKDLMDKSNRKKEPLKKTVTAKKSPPKKPRLETIAPEDMSSAFGPR
ncbi:MAG TPA: hypothetical protein VK564_07255, partial [Thermodesulfobacteriota bacterium]|nr:hypothetical protein [Thermodesulfobacteriota bacterium]